MTLTALAASDGPTLWTLFGRFHPATVHFPIALLTLAAALEIWQLLRRKNTFHRATLTCTIVALVSAIVASLMGWANASGKKHDDTLETHRWAGIVTTGIVLIATVLAVKARSREGGLVHGARAALILGMVLVGLTGHWGGQLTLGDQYYSSAAPDWLAWLFPKKVEADNGAPPNGSVGVAKVDFEHQIAPIIQAACLKCHGDQKPKGKLRLNTKENTMKGGGSGKCVKPGDSANSTFYTLLIDPDPDVRMPEKAAALPKAQIELIRRWIDEGATWPDGFMIKPLDQK